MARFIGWLFWIVAITGEEAIVLEICNYQYFIYIYNIIIFYFKLCYTFFSSWVIAFKLYSVCILVFLTQNLFYKHGILIFNLQVQLWKCLHSQFLLPFLTLYWVFKIGIINQNTFRWFITICVRLSSCVFRCALPVAILHFILLKKLQSQLLPF